MKNLRKTLAAIVAFAMLLSFAQISTFAYTDVEKGSSVGEAVSILSNLGIFQGFEDGSFRPSDTVTRAQMAAIVCRMLGYEEQAQSSGGYTDFSDVDGSHWASGYINVAKSLGIINGFPGGYFAPEDKVTYEQAVKMIVCALNYELVAQGKGGYPNGYLSVASAEGITKNSGGRIGEVAARATLAMLVYNSLEVRLLDQSSWSTNGEDEFSKSDDTILSKYLGVEKWEGVVTKTPLTDYAEGYDSDDDPMITIKGYYKAYINGVLTKVDDDEIKKADCSLVDADGLLGKRVVAYIGDEEDDETGNIMVYAISEKNNGNEVVSISSTQLVDSEDKEWDEKGQISYRKIGYTKVYDVDLDDDAVFYVNYEEESSLDKYTKTSDIAKIIENGGMIELISNDSDSDAEFVIINMFSDESVIKEVEEEDGIYSFRLYNNGNLEEIDTEADDELVIIYKDGLLAEADDLDDGDTVSTVEIGRDVRVLYVSSESVEGDIDSYDEETVTINNSDYEISPFLKKKPSSLKDEEGTFFLNVNGQIAYNDSDASVAGNYGLVLAIDYVSGISEGYVAQVALSDGSVVEYDLSSKVKVYDKNGTQVESGDEEAANYLAYIADGTTSVKNSISRTLAKNAHKMIFRFTTRNGEISKIKAPTGDSYSNYLDANTKRYDEDSMSYGAVEFDKNTVVFSIDGAYSNSSTRVVYDDDITVGNVARFFADGEDNYHFAAIDEDDGIYRVVIGFDISSSVSEEGDAVIITEKRTVTYNDEDAVKISGIRGGKEVSYTIYDENDDFSWGDDPEYLEKGDVILVSNSGNSGLVSDFKLLYKASKNGIGKVSAKAVEGDPSDDIYNAVGYLVKDKTTNTKFYLDTAVTNKGGTFADENDGITMKSSANYTIVDYSENTKNPTIQRKNPGSALFSTSSKYESYVFVRVYDDVLTEVVVYKFAAESSARKTVKNPVIGTTGDGKVKIECATEDADIYYTTDGSNPSKSSNKYSAPFEAEGSVTVKAYAVKSGYENSETVSKAITKKVEKPQISIENNVATITCATEGAEIYYTLDASTPTKESTKYTFAVTLESGTIKAIAVKENWDDSEIASASYTAQVSEPEINLNGKNMSITCATEGAEIYYTLDGNKPSKADGTKYENPVELNENASIKAIAVKENYKDSDIASVGFTVQVAEPEISLSGNTLTIKCDTKDADIFYTLDGSNPTASNDKYSAPVELKNPATIKAIALKDGCTSSKVDVKNFSPQVKKPAVKISGDKLTITCATEDAEIYYTLDASNPTKESTKYTKEVVLEKAVTVKAIAVKAGYENSDVDSASYVPQTAKPVIKLTGNKFTITCATEGAEIYYTLDGREPTAKATKYSKETELKKDAVIKAVAIKAGYKDSAVASEIYKLVISKPVLDKAVLDKAVLDKAVLDKAVIDKNAINKAVVDKSVIKKSETEKLSELTAKSSVSEENIKAVK